MPPLFREYKRRAASITAQLSAHSSQKLGTVPHLQTSGGLEKCSSVLYLSLTLSPPLWALFKTFLPPWVLEVMGKDKHPPTEAEVKVATVDLESVDNMATLPVGQHRQQGSDIAIAEKHNNANKEMELKCVQPKPSKKYVICSILVLFFFT